MRKIKKFDKFCEAVDVRAILKQRKEQDDNKKVDHMLKNALLFRRIKLTDQIEALEKRRNELMIEIAEDPYVKTNPNPETNPVLAEYNKMLADIDLEIAEISKKIEDLKK